MAGIVDRISWEYFTVYFRSVAHENEVADKMEWMGDRGWELVTVLFNNVQYVAFFKRRK